MTQVEIVSHVNNLKKKHSKKDIALLTKALVINSSFNIKDYMVL